MMSKKKNKKRAQPMQPIVLDDRGRPVFQENPIVRFLLDWAKARGMGLNELQMMSFDNCDREHFAQLIGYSVGGYSELSYVSDVSYNKAEAEAKKTGFPWQQGVEVVDKWLKDNDYPVE